MLNSDVLDRMQRIFENVTGNTELKVTENMSIDKDLKVSSLTKIQLICAIEDEFEIEIPNRLLKKLKKVGDLYAFMETVELH